MYIYIYYYFILFLKILQNGTNVLYLKVNRIHLGTRITQNDYNRSSGTICIFEIMLNNMCDNMFGNMVQNTWSTLHVRQHDMMLALCAAALLRWRSNAQRILDNVFGNVFDNMFEGMVDDFSKYI